MQTVYDIQQLLKKFGIFIYTGNRLGDLELMESELKQLYQIGMIELQTYQLGLLVLKKERRQN
jgi:uncharacterized protein YqgQ